MKITFIGTSHGVPESDKRCSSTMIEISGRYYFIDMGTNSIEDLRKKGIAIEDVHGVFITHCHGDHTNGLINFVDLVNWYFKNADPKILMPEQEAIDAMLAWLSANGTTNRGIKFEIVREGVTYDDGFIKITAIRTAHCRTSYAYLVEAEGKKVLFTGDLGHNANDYPQVAFEEETELIVTECAHFSPKITEKILENAKTKRVLFNHYFRDSWGADMYEVIHREHDYRCGVAFDGMEINL